jgi:hypothetical protein
MISRLFKIDHFLANATETSALSNYTRVYEQYKEKISNYCITANEIEHMHNNKTKFIWSNVITQELSKATFVQIGLKELFRHISSNPQWYKVIILFKGVNFLHLKMTIIYLN